MKIDYVPLSVEYDHIYILDCLPEKDRAAGIADETDSFLKDRGYGPVVLKVDSAPDLDIQLAKLVSLSEKEHFMIHFVAHGNENGIGAGGTDRVPWNRFTPFLAQISRNTTDEVNKKGTLILNMTSCKGLHGIKIALDEIASVVYGVIGPAEPILSSTAKRVNNLFYTKLSEGIPIQDIKRELDLQFPLIHVATQQGFNVLHAKQRGK